jgi:hypothetical protein
MSTTGTDMRLHHQWATRPDDERYATLAALETAVKIRKNVSVETTTSNMLVVMDGEDIQLRLSDNIDETAEHCKLTHWSFGQLCRMGGAPADYLRSLPPVLAAPALQWSVEQRTQDQPFKVMSITKRGVRAPTVRAITSPTYGRVWDLDVVNALKSLGDEWHVPAASYSGTDPKRATTLYASDRDIFVFLERAEPVDIGGGQALNRGVMAWNSEVGAASFGLSTFTYDHVCDNRIIWGVSDRIEIRFRHTSGAPARVMSEARPMLAAYAQDSGTKLLGAVKAARAKSVGKDRESVEEWMRQRGFTKVQAEAAYAYAERDERKQGLNPRSVWGLVQGVTDYAHTIAHTDARTKVERGAGELLDAIVS